VTRKAFVKFKFGKLQICV